MSSPRKEWHLRPADPAAAAYLAKAAGISEAVAQLLLHRGITTAPAARAFLDAPMAAWHAPELLPGVPAAADRLARAVAGKKRICVYGDYDADGVTGTAILLAVLTRLGAAAEFYIPNRLDVPGSYAPNRLDVYDLRREIAREAEHDRIRTRLGDPVRWCRPAGVPGRSGLLIVCR